MQNSDSFIHYSNSHPHVFAGMIAREIWWTNQEVSPAGIIINMALYAHSHQGGEK
jgi:hypothetical protein